MIMTPTRDHPLPDETAIWHLEQLGQDLPKRLAEVSQRNEGGGFDILSEQVAVVRIHHDRGERLERDLALLRLFMLERDLNLVTTSNEEAANRIAVRLAAADHSNWYGFRFELNIAATLALKDVVFVSNEDRATVPDFTVALPGGHIGVECTSTRLTSRRDDPVAWKIGAASNSKAAKPYAHSATALFIDVTGLVAVPGQGPSVLTLEDIREQFESHIDTNSYGSYIITSTNVEMDAQPLRIGNRYFRHDGQAPSELLKGFIDEHYPMADPDSQRTALFPIGFP